MKERLIETFLTLLGAFSFFLGARGIAPRFGFGSTFVALLTIFGGLWVALTLWFVKRAARRRDLRQDVNDWQQRGGAAKALDKLAVDKESQGDYEAAIQLNEQACRMFAVLDGGMQRSAELHERLAHLNHITLKYDVALQHLKDAREKYLNLADTRPELRSRPAYQKKLAQLTNAIARYQPPPLGLQANQ